MPGSKPTPTPTDIIEDVMHAFKAGELKSGSGDKVTKRKQAIAIALSEAGRSNEHSPVENARNLKRTLKKKKA
jgi:Family of unknown function (DUF6496)